MPSPTLPPQPNGSSANLVCPCGAQGHGPEDHLWNVKQVGQAAHRSGRQVNRDRLDTTCPLHGVGWGRGSQKNVWAWAEVKAYLRWLSARFLAEGA